LGGPVGWPRLAACVQNGLRRSLESATWKRYGLSAQSARETIDSGCWVDRPTENGVGFPPKSGLEASAPVRMSRSASVTIERSYIAHPWASPKIGAGRLSRSAGTAGVAAATA